MLPSRLQSVTCSCCVHAHTHSHAHTAPQMRASPLSLLSCVCLLRLLSSRNAFEFGQFSRCAQSSLTAPGRRLKGGESERQFQSEKKERKKEGGGCKREIRCCRRLPSLPPSGSEESGGREAVTEGGMEAANLLLHLFYSCC